MKKALRFAIIIEIVLLGLFFLTSAFPSFEFANRGIRYLHIVGLAAWRVLDSLAPHGLDPLGALFVVVPVQVLIWVVFAWIVQGCRHENARNVSQPDASKIG